MNLLKFRNENKFLIKFMKQNSIYIYIYIKYFFQGVMAQVWALSLSSQPALYYVVWFPLASSGRVLYGLYCGRYVE